MALPTSDIGTDVIRSTLGIVSTPTSFGDMCTNGTVCAAGLNAAYCSGATPALKLANLQSTPYEISKFRGYDHAAPITVQFNTDGSLYSDELYGQTISIGILCKTTASISWASETGDTPTASSETTYVYGGSSGGALASVTCNWACGWANDTDTQTFTLTGITASNINTISFLVTGSCYAGYWDEFFDGVVRITSVTVTSGSGTGTVGYYNEWHGDCGGLDRRNYETPTLSLNPTSWNFGEAGGSKAITVTANSVNYWAATEGQSWLSITAPPYGTGNGSFTINCTANSGAARGPANVSVSSDAATQYVSITQDGVSYSVDATPSSAIFYADGTEYPGPGGSSILITVTASPNTWSVSITGTNADKFGTSYNDSTSFYVYCTGPNMSAGNYTATLDVVNGTAHDYVSLTQLNV